MEPSSKSLLLRNARAVLPQRLSGPAQLLIEEGTIVRIDESNSTLSAETHQVDLQGATLFPGFIDVHIHGAVGVDTLAASAADIERVSQFLATKGVTGWMPTLVPGSAEDYAGAIAAIGAANDASGARVLGVHYEGPFVNSLQCGALRSEFFRTFSNVAELNALPSLSAAGARHLITLAPEIEGGIALIADLTRRGWIVSIGHTRADSAVLDDAFAAGARHLTHFMNAMPSLHHRSVGPVSWGLLRDDVTCDFIADGIHLASETLKLLVKVKTPERLSLISDAIAAAGCGDGDYQIWGQTISVKDGRSSNAAGHIAGSVITLIDAVRMMLRLGVSVIEVAQMASGNPAKLLQLEDECGSIEAGKRADLVAIDDEGEVVLTVIGGDIVFRKQ